MTTYSIPKDRITRACADVMRRYHGELDDMETRIDILLAHARTDDHGDPVGPAIKANGHRCAAKVRIMPLKDRVAGRGDAEILLDGDRCDTWSDEQLKAILDHELTHLELRVNDEGEVKRDDIGRPVLQMRDHDHQFGWFDSVARRHGEASVEVQQASQLLREIEYRQLYLPGMDELVASQGGT